MESMNIPRLTISVKSGLVVWSIVFIVRFSYGSVKSGKPGNRIRMTCLVVLCAHHYGSLALY